MEKLWEGRAEGGVTAAAEEFNSSLAVDKRMYREDITGSVAHAKMLIKQNIIPEAAGNGIIAGLNGILSDMDAGRLEADPAAEDIHSFVEAELTRRIGDAGKMLHTARSRNDQVALDTRLYLRARVKDALLPEVRELCVAFTDVALRHTDTVMPGYTHLQRAQPVSFGQHMMAYCEMLMRDMRRLSLWLETSDASPIGACALAGTTYPTDREYEAELLGFSGICKNSMDAVSDRDFVLELSADCSIIMMHLSRLSEELILWSSQEFDFITLPDGFTTGSSIMPQKKNPDMAELIRGKTGRVYGDMTALFTLMKGLPLAYNKDMQEDKEAIFDAVDTVEKCLLLLPPMLRNAVVKKDSMLDAACDGLIAATDIADYLTRRGMPFRQAYKTVGQIVRYCVSSGKMLEEITLDEYRGYSELFDADIYPEISPKSCMERRTSRGGVAPSEVTAQIKAARAALGCGE